MGMVKIMICRSSTKRKKLRLCPAPLIAAVTITGLYDSECEENPNSNTMNRYNMAQNFITNKSWKRIPKNMFQRMSILGCYRYRGFKFMMTLMNPIKLWSMQSWMSEIKEKIFHQQEKHKLPNYSFSIRYFPHSNTIITHQGITNS